MLHDLSLGQTKLIYVAPSKKRSVHTYFSVQRLMKMDKIAVYKYPFLHSPVDRGVSQFGKSHYTTLKVIILGNVEAYKMNKEFQSDNYQCI